MGYAKLGSIWAAAKEDAGLEDAVLMPLAGHPPVRFGPGAKWFFPGEELVSEPEFPMDPGQVREANDAPKREKHRIAVWAGVSEVPLAAKLRHELEHARQWDTCGSPFVAFDQCVRRAVEAAFGPPLGTTRPGSARIYNLVPSEVSANAAAVEYVRRTYGAEAVAPWQDDPRHDALFAERVDPAPLERLPRHTLCFAALVAREFEQRVGHGGLNEQLAAAGEPDKALWRQLCNDERVQQLARGAREVVPSPAEIERHGDRPGQAWEAVVDRLREGYGRALEVAG
jgi:hypothetical protein